MEIVCTLFSFRVCNIYAYAYEYGIVAVGHKELPVRKSGHRIRFNHPYELTEDVIAKVLSNIHYREKGLFKRIRTLNVFQDKETKQLVPLIVHAFSVATPAQVVTVSSYSERLLLTDRHNYCVLFMDDRNLNIVFSHVHKFQTYNDIMSEKKKVLLYGIRKSSEKETQRFLEISSFCRTTVRTRSRKLACHKFIKRNPLIT